MHKQLYFVNRLVIITSLTSFKLLEELLSTAYDNTAGVDV